MSGLSFMLALPGNQTMRNTVKNASTGPHHPNRMPAPTHLKNAWGMPPTSSGLTAAQYSAPVLGLIFLLFAETRFAQLRAQLLPSLLVGGAGGGRAAWEMASVSVPAISPIATLRDCAKPPPSPKSKPKAVLNLGR